MWTLFWDMNSGGGQKEKWSKIYIEADKETAKVIFYNRFGHNPYRVTCTCCGEDYSIYEEESLEQLSGYHRNCPYKDGKYYEKDKSGIKNSKYLTVDEYKKLDNVLIIPKENIKEEEKRGHVPEQGYV